MAGGAQLSVPDMRRSTRHPVDVPVIGEHRTRGTSNSCRGPEAHTCYSFLELPGDVEPQSIGFIELCDVDLLVLETQVQAIEHVDAEACAPN